MRSPVMKFACRLIGLPRPFPVFGCGVFAALILAVAPLHGQESRAELVEAARAEFDDARAVDLLLKAADPAGAPLDSLWAVSVHELAFALVRVGDEDAAELWLRWGARHGADWPLDRSLFPPRVVAVWERALARVSDGPAPRDGELGTIWRLGSEGGTGAPGRLEVGSVADVATLEIALDGPGAPESHAASELSDRDLLPGTYTVTVSASGFETLVVDREVLPGAVVRLEVDLMPSLSAEARADGDRVLARVEWLGAAPGCINGILVRDGRSVVAPLLPLGDRENLRVMTSVGERLGLGVVRTDPERGLALIPIEPGAGPVGTPSAVTSADASAARHAWAMYRAGCDPVQTVGLRLEAATGGWLLTGGLPIEALGAPLLDPSGGVLGLVTGPARGLALSELDSFLNPVVAQVLPPPQVQGGRLPWKWIGAGAALAGVGAVLATRGGDNGPPPPTTGSIVIRFPSG
jgi:hypothetical protein